jgi:TRAP-type C4-dicarboxylate transport system permease small subunit
MIAALVGMLFYGVVMRYAFRMPPAWTMEMSRYVFLWMVMFGAVLVTRDGDHIRMSFLLTLLPGRVRAVVQKAIEAVMLFVSCVMIIKGIAILPVVGEARSPTLGLPMSWLYASIPVGGALMVVYIIEKAFQVLRQ